MNVLIAVHDAQLMHESNRIWSTDSPTAKWCQELRVDNLMKIYRLSSRNGETFCWSRKTIVKKRTQRLSNDETPFPEWWSISRSNFHCSWYSESQQRRNKILAANVDFRYQNAWTRLLITKNKIQLLYSRIKDKTTRTLILMQLLLPNEKLLKEICFRRPPGDHGKTVTRRCLKESYDMSKSLTRQNFHSGERVTAVGGTISGKLTAGAMHDDVNKFIILAETMKSLTCQRWIPKRSNW